MDILIIPDAHAKPGVSNERFTWLGRLIADRQPDAVVSIGDFADMPSLSHYDAGKKSFEGRRYKQDCEVTHDALRRVDAGIEELNVKLRAKKVKQYTPIKVITLGNHENRINKVINNDPKLDGTIGIEDLGYEEHGWEVIPFLEPLELEGVIFQHYMTSGNMDRSIGGMNIGRALLKRTHGSCFVGHSHLLDIAWEANSQGKLMTAGSVGAYFEHKEDYVSKQAQSHWWRGVVLLKNVSNGIVGDMEMISMTTIKRDYK